MDASWALLCLLKYLRTWAWSRLSQPSPRPASCFGWPSPRRPNSAFAVLPQCLRPPGRREMEAKEMRWVEAVVLFFHDPTLSRFYCNLFSISFLIWAHFRSSVIGHRSSPTPPSLKPRRGTSPLSSQPGPYLLHKPRRTPLASLRQLLAMRPDGARATCVKSQTAICSPFERFLICEWCE